MDDVVIKPYRLDDLLQKIENMMRIRSSRNTVDPANGSAVETPDAIEVEVEMGVQKEIDRRPKWFP